MDRALRLVALLPMKAHSERVKGKNFRVLHSKPLFRWILDTLLSIEEIDLVVINTDAESLLRENGLELSDRILIRPRRRELCGDFVSMNSILQDDIVTVPAECYVMTHTTNPLLRASTIRSALGLYYSKKANDLADSLFSVTKCQSRFYRADGSPVNHDPKNLVRTQDLEPWFEENSNLYIFSATSFLATNARIGQMPILFPIPKPEAVDIDDQDDWTIVEMLMKGMFA